MGLNLDDLFAQANKFKESMAQAKQLLDSRTIEVSGGHGAVVVVISGLAKIKVIRLAPDALTLLGREGLESTLVSTVNEAFDRSKDLAAKTMSELTGFNLENISELF
ncbi:YbaB/EbfC family nucleoid-associated protein [Zhaonella formicivorans]|jgi:DNA-binding protein YbaB|uniref:YbaB/EbfC family nucleoid-associated protein n=1 Tax=Zhaonella formicivorans TaxID=2528593 RepID=UPI0010EA40DF|nr:YbaB/EbfC family nucleoid-associated protein [Zhaonella formicivorans]